MKQGVLIDMVLKAGWSKTKAADESCYTKNNYRFRFEKEGVAVKEIIVTDTTANGIFNFHLKQHEINKTVVRELLFKLSLPRFDLFYDQEYNSAEFMVSFERSDAS